MLSFNPTAIADIISRGYEAARIHEEELAAIKAQMPSASLTRTAEPAIDLSAGKVSLSSIEFEGLSRHESRLLMRKTGLSKKTEVSKYDLDLALCGIQSTNAFETSSYSLYGDSEPYRLVFESVRKPVHQLGLGFRADTQDGASFLIGLGLNANKLRGLKLDLESRVSRNFYVRSLLSLDLRALPSLNLEVKGFSYNHEFLQGDGSHLNSIRYAGHTESFYLSNSTWTFMALKAGLMNRYFGTASLLSDINSADDLLMKGDVFSAFVSADICTFDDRYYPTSGKKFAARAEWMLELPQSWNVANTLQSFDLTEPVVSLDYYRAFSGNSPKTVLVVDMHGRSILSDQPLLFMRNAVGGMMPGRYLEQQVPFVGFNRMLLTDSQLLAANVEFRLNPLRNFYLSALAGGVNTSMELDALLSDSSRTLYGFGVQVGYNTIAGPVRLLVNWSSLDHEFGCCLSAGFDF